MTSADYLDALRARYNLPSDYRVAKLLGMKTQQVSRYRTGRTFDDVNALRVAELLGVEPGVVLADMAAQRANDDQVRAAWTRTARRLAGTAAAVLVALGVAAPPTADAGQPPPAARGPLCVMSSRIGVFRAFLTYYFRANRRTPVRHYRPAVPLAA